MADLKPGRIRLATKLNALTIALILLTAATLSVTVVLEQGKEITQGLLDNGITLANVVARNAEYGVYTENEEVLKELIQTLKVDPDMDFAAVLNRQGGVLSMQRFRQPAGGGEAAPRGPSFRPVAESAQESTVFINTDRGIEITVPVIGARAATVMDEYYLDRDLQAEGEVLGYAVIALSKDGVARRTGNMLYKVVAVTFFVSIFGVIATLFMTRRIVRPLQVLHGAVEKVSEDETVQTLDVQSTDEIGDLSKSFNAMLASLRDSRARIEERSNALKAAKEEVERQNEELKQLDKMKDSFISAVSHEMKTPVAKHAMQLDIFRPVIERHSLAEHEMKAFSVMEDCIKRQQTTVRNLLNLSQLEEGKIAYQMEEIMLDGLVGQVIEDYRSEVDNYGLRVDVDIPEIAIEGDRNMLWHVFSNVISNSIKFRRETGSPSISILARGAEDHVRIEIRDNGKGMAGKDIAAAFHRFYQASPSIEGSGVGLSIARMIVDGHRGKIWMDSEGPAKGTLTSIVLPLRQEAGHG